MLPKTLQNLENLFKPLRRYPENAQIATKIVNSIENCKHPLNAAQACYIVSQTKRQSQDIISKTWPWLISHSSSDHIIRIAHLLKITLDALPEEHQINWDEHLPKAPDLKMTLLPFTHMPDLATNEAERLADILMHLSLVQLSNSSDEPFPLEDNLKALDLNLFDEPLKVFQVTINRIEDILKKYPSTYPAMKLLLYFIMGEKSTPCTDHIVFFLNALQNESPKTLNTVNQYMQIHLKKDLFSEKLRAPLIDALRNLKLTSMIVEALNFVEAMGNYLSYEMYIDELTKLFQKNPTQSSRILALLKKHYKDKSFSDPDELIFKMREFSMVIDYKKDELKYQSLTDADIEKIMFSKNPRAMLNFIVNAKQGFQRIFESYPRAIDTHITACESALSADPNYNYIPGYNYIPEIVNRANFRSIPLPLHPSYEAWVTHSQLPPIRLSELLTLLQQNQGDPEKLLKYQSKDLIIAPQDKLKTPRTLKDLCILALSMQIFTSGTRSSPKPVSAGTTESPYPS